MPRGAGSGGELDVFGATRYFDGFANLAAGPFVNVMEAEDVMIQVKATHDMNHMEESYRSIQDLGPGSKPKRNFATLFGSLVSPAGSFRMNPTASGSTTTTTSGSHDEPPELVSSSFSRGTAVLSRDLGELVGDRRLQGVRVVRGASGEEERWVVRCGGRALDEEHHVRQKIVDAASSDDHQAVQGVEDGDDFGSDSDTSSDLFELDLQNANSH
uniref:Uncharacterized protein n=1 Tax=Avena sativa TaxID=4498 RepID=A0ACD5WX29_AVESA